jgi:prolyl-tRNA editing enzyme YbaK/EbsC (Cys-tRNA(Pro) deacylase)
MNAVFEYLQGRGVVFTVIPHRPGEDGRIRPVDVPDEATVRTEVVMTGSGPSIMVISGNRELDLDLARAAVGDPEARRATELELLRLFPGYEPGTVPPLSLMLLAPMYVDPAVAARRAIVFAAGRSDVSVRIATRDLFGTDPVVITPLTTPAPIQLVDPA